MSTGTRAVISSSCSTASDTGGGATLVTPSASHTNCRSAVTSRSGRSVWMTRTRWKAVTERPIADGHSFSATGDRAQRSHEASPRLSCASSDGNVDAKSANCVSRSAPAHSGKPRARAPRSATRSPTMYAHSLAPNSSGSIPCTKCSANMRRSALKSERPTNTSTRRCSAGTSRRMRSSTEPPSRPAASVARKRSTKEPSENWYMLLIDSIMRTRKNICEPALAKGR
mmetsp:Transcript_2075/g.6733  ORF Transcript_2075/g.6733 Transcript_2075/m.6733 type:complete len:227 (-) Transcript_2075:2783-3463(-)